MLEASTSGVRWRCRCGGGLPGSSQTVCQIPSSWCRRQFSDISFQYCLPRGMVTSRLGSSARTTRMLSCASPARACVTSAENGVSALVGGYLRAVHPDRRAVVHSRSGAGAARRPRRILEGAGVPDDVVEGCLADAGELRLVAVGDGDPAVERRVSGLQVLGVTLCQPLASPVSESSKAKLHSPFRIRPVLPAELRTRVLGSWNRDQGVVPFC